MNGSYHLCLPARRSPQRLLAIVDAATAVFAEVGFSAAGAVTPELAARFMLETVTWWARHRHRDPAPPAIDDPGAREVAISLVTRALATRPDEP